MRSFLLMFDRNAKFIVAMALTGCSDGYGVRFGSASGLRTTNVYDRERRRLRERDFVRERLRESDRLRRVEPRRADPLRRERLCERLRLRLRERERDLRPRFPRDLDLDLRLSLLRDLRLGTVWVSGLCPLFLYTQERGLKGYGADSAWVRSTLS